MNITKTVKTAEEYEEVLRKAFEYADEGGGLGCINAVSFSAYRVERTGATVRLPDPPRMMGEAAIRNGCQVGDRLGREWDGNLYEIVRDGVGPFASDVTPPHVKTAGELEQDRLWQEHKERRYLKDGRRNLKYRKLANEECEVASELFFRGDWRGLLAMLRRDLTPLARRHVIHDLSHPSSPYRDEAEGGKLT